jgi:DNA-binding transcriptional ArsR family regulator
MEDEARELAQLSAQLADPARATMIMSLMDGSSRSAGELGLAANVSPSSASGHLSRLVDSRILTNTKQGRHKYYRIATAAVAHAVEALQIVASTGTVLRQVGQSTLNPFAFARTCYDHLAGKLGVEVTAALQRQKILSLAGKGYEITSKGRDWLDDFGVDWRELQSERRSLALQCLDFTERRPHLAGALGAAMLKRMIELDWIAKNRVPRSVRLTSKGRTELSKNLQIVFTENGIRSARDLRSHQNPK